MLSQIVRIPSGFIDSVNDPVIGMAAAPGGTGVSKFAGQLGMEFELRTDMIRLKNPAVPVARGKFMYVRLAAAASSPAVGATVNWDATVARNLYQVTTAAGTAAGTVLSTGVTPGYYTVIQTSALPPTGTITLTMLDGTEREVPEPGPQPESASATEPAPAPEVAAAPPKTAAPKPATR